MLYVGLDIHSSHISICALTETGQVAHRSRVRSIEETLVRQVQRIEQQLNRQARRSSAFARPPSLAGPRRPSPPPSRNCGKA